MWFIPYERLIIRTSLREEQIQDKLENNIEPVKFLAWAKSSHKPYQGKINEQHFTAVRIIGYRNSFLPVINGNIHTKLGTSYIELKMHLHPITIAFLVFWLGGVGLGFVTSLANILEQVFQKGILQKDLIPGLFLLGLMFLFGYFLTLGGFKVEAGKAKRFFSNLFETSEGKNFNLMGSFH